MQNVHLKERGYLAMGGQIIDASIVPVPKQRNSRPRAWPGRSRYPPTFTPTASFFEVPIR